MTALLIVLFLGIVGWAWNPRAQQDVPRCWPCCRWKTTTSGRARHEHFWSLFVIFITAINLVGLAWTAVRHRAQAAGGQPEGATTSHTWDGDITELNNPLPRWWLGMFILTMVFALVYLALYPGLGNVAGKLGWTSQKGEVADHVAATNAKLDKLFARFRDRPLAELARDPGRSTSATTCSSTTARPATARTRAAPRASPT